MYSLFCIPFFCIPFLYGCVPFGIPFCIFVFPLFYFCIPILYFCIFVFPFCTLCIPFFNFVVPLFYFCIIFFYFRIIRFHLSFHLSFHNTFHNTYIPLYIIILRGAQVSFRYVVLLYLFVLQKIRSTFILCIFLNFPFRNRCTNQKLTKKKLFQLSSESSMCTRVRLIEIIGDPVSTFWLFCSPSDKSEFD